MNTTPPDISEFIDTYSDDISILLTARAALLTHPLRSDYAFADPIDAAVCRLFIVTMIGSIEMLLKNWQERDQRGILKKYFDRNAHNGDKIRNMCEAFRSAGFGVDERVFEDYLAIKYLRNTIVHFAWKDSEKQFVEKCGFPTDTRKLTREHLIRVDNVNQNMMLYAAVAGLRGPQPGLPSGLMKVERPSPELSDLGEFIRIRELDQIIWNNIERLSAVLFRAIESVATNEEYAHTVRLIAARVQSTATDDQKSNYFVVMREVGLERPEAFAQSIEAAGEAFEFWNEYRARALFKKGIVSERSRQFRAVLESAAVVLVQVPYLAQVSKLPKDIGRKLLVDLLGAEFHLAVDEVLNALEFGETAYYAIPNITPLSLLTCYLPVLDPANTEQHLQAARDVLDVFILGRTWYSLVERRHLPDAGSFNTYISLISAFSARGMGHD